MTEEDDGRAKVYWLAYKSQLLRAAPRHVRPEIGKSSEPLVDNFQTAKDVVQQLRSRGVTRYLDLNVLNKRRLEDVGTDEEVLDDGDTDLEQPARRRRLLDSILMESHPLLRRSTLPPFAKKMRTLTTLILDFLINKVRLLDLRLLLLHLDFWSRHLDLLMPMELSFKFQSRNCQLTFRSAVENLLKNQAPHTWMLRTNSQ